MAKSDTSSVVVCSAAKLRRMALAQQGLLNTRGLGSGKTGVASAITHLGYVQIDTISVVERAHHHVLWTRVKNYQAEFLDAAVRNQEIFEYWFHAAAYLPINDFRFALDDKCATALYTKTKKKKIPAIDRIPELFT